MKECNKCEIKKDNNEFYKGRTECKSCISAQRKAHYTENSDRLKERQRTYNKVAKETISLHKKQYYIDNKEVIVIRKLEYYEKNRESILHKGREYWAKNRESKGISQRARYQKNKEKYLFSHRKWERNNRGLTRALNAKRRAAKKQAVPKWLTLEHKQQIKSIYKEARRLELLDGIKRHVDHIIPLQSPIICGLHVPWNLQILTASDNSRKKNKLLDKAPDSKVR